MARTTSLTDTIRMVSTACKGSPTKPPRHIGNMTKGSRGRLDNIAEHQILTHIRHITTVVVAIDMAGKRCQLTFEPLDLVKSLAEI
jgi:hypothetical protein